MNVHQDEDFNNVLEKIRNAFPQRNFDNIHRRILKLTEETGEVAEAYLYSTSSHNKKNKSFMDIREEAVDAAIVAMCIAMTPHPTQEDSDMAYKNMLEMFDNKISKWINKISDNVTGVDETSTEEVKIKTVKYSNTVGS